MKFVPVPGTEVLFCIHETRWRDYAEYAMGNPEIVQLWRNQTHNGFVLKAQAEDHPVVSVSWGDATAFCRWLSAKEKRTYRLPTDREWSQAVGIGNLEVWKTGTTPENVSRSLDVYPWGDEWPPPPGSGNYGDQSRKLKAPVDEEGYLESYDDGFPTTAPVGSFAPNLFGLHDMGGNVWEWVEDWWNAERQWRVLRGGAWRGYRMRNLLSSDRARLREGHRGAHYGFRIVLDLSPSSGDPAGQ